MIKTSQKIGTERMWQPLNKISDFSIRTKILLGVVLYFFFDLIVQVIT